MNFIDVLRFEDSFGRGCYSSPFSPYSYSNFADSPAACRLRELMRQHNGGGHHPPPLAVGEPWDVSMPRPGDVCGFKDLDQVCDWFSDEEVELLLDFGFSLVNYRVSVCDATIGQKQVCFVKGACWPTIILAARAPGSDGWTD